MTIKTIQTPEGDKLWRPVSERTAQFNKDYPSKSGYRVVFVRKDALSYQAGRLELYKAAINAGQSFEKVGLPPLNDVTTMVVEATLYGQDDKPITSGTAAKQILEYKDWERLETAAFQRLLAKLGYHGEVLDADEDAEIAALAKTPAPVQAATPAPVVEQPRQAAPQQEPTEPAVTAQKVETAAPAANVTTFGNKVPASLLNQIKRHCKRRGVEVPTFETADQAIRYLAELSSPQAQQNEMAMNQ